MFCIIKECINQTKSAYYSTMVCANDDSAKTPFSLFNSSFRSPDFLPAHPRPGLFHVALPLQFHSHHTVFLLSSFPLSLIFQISSVSQNLGKACLTSLLPLISAIIYSSLTTGTVPASFKVAAITPILKTKQNTKQSKTKQSLDPNNFDNFCLISNLPFLSKILEKIVATQLHSYLTNNNLYEQFQSGFRPSHSTETALIKITNDLLMAADYGLLSILILLDLSAAFDTISHSILLSRLVSIGLSHTPLAWLWSMSHRTQFIRLKSFTSQPFRLVTGISKQPGIVSFYLLEPLLVDAVIHFIFVIFIFNFIFALRLNNTKNLIH